MKVPEQRETVRILMNVKLDNIIVIKTLTASIPKVVILASAKTDMKVVAQKEIVRILMNVK